MGEIKRRQMRTHSLTDDWILDSVNASSKHGECESRVETEVQEDVPSFPTDSDCAGKHREHMVNMLNS